MQKWNPEAGDELQSLLSRQSNLDGDARLALEEEAIRILGQGISPSAAGCETGIVMGYVQSGKTLSFESVMALASDNNFQIIILIAGTSKLLLGQSVRRLKRDLGLEEISRPKRWSHLQNPKNDQESQQAMSSILSGWQSDLPPGMVRQSLLVTVMKHHTHLANLIALVNSSNVGNVPVLIIDDEADQASLNAAVKSGKLTTTHERIVSLRECFENCTYLQYTATPQAPLLISCLDVLSPNFIHVLDPGEGYVGGKDFFTPNSDYVSIIPDNDLVDMERVEIPESLKQALMIFIMGSTIGLTAGKVQRFSMLVHPSFQTLPHAQYYQWTKSLLDCWQETMELNEAAPEKQELLEEFEPIYCELAKTLPSDAPSFDESKQWIGKVVETVQSREVNTSDGPTPEIDWNLSQVWILIGGQSLDRGFTVEGLTVTYMPRGPGVGNADTIQQRARFFGYKRQYLEYCRVFITQEMVDAYQGYIEHEEALRNSMQTLNQASTPLNDWKRHFILDPTLKPCRSTVLGKSYTRYVVNDDWEILELTAVTDPGLAENCALVDAFLSSIPFSNALDFEGEGSAQRHEVSAGVPLGDLLSGLLLPWCFSDTKSANKNNLLLTHLARIRDENPSLKCPIYKMRPSQSWNRTVDDNGKVLQLFQGANPSSNYRGDREIRVNDQISVQIHRLNLTRKDNGQRVASNVPVLAIWIPRAYGIHFVQQ